MTIPKIIHQIWSGVNEPLPKQFRNMGETWKKHYPAWRYELWDNKRMIEFVRNYFPQYWDIYDHFPYNIQRWDAIRYLILYKIGGMYVDFDYESLRSMDEIVRNKTCCFSMEPYIHRPVTKDFNNALMLCTPGHFFMKRIIERVFCSNNRYDTGEYTMDEIVFSTTGPWLINNLYTELTNEEKNEIFLIPSEFVSPLDMWQTKAIINGTWNINFENILKEAYAIHYYCGGWNK
ncbi:MAG: glycosyltransferase [Fermentimonas sp.]|nr:glycosyltransferase [Dysgonamonadaceae bacterium]MDD4698157.1 glycosyltransferase [Fermentimonas sp.]